jgi:hypothetical protein
LRGAVARNGKLVVAAALLSAMLAACGGGGGGDGASAAAPAASPTSSGGTAGLSGVAAAKGATTLSWTPPTMNDDGTPLKLTGYRIYWGLTEGHYPHSVTLTNPGLTRYVVEQLTPAKWYFVATALSVDGESPPSNVIAMQIQ